MHEPCARHFVSTFTPPTPSNTSQGMTKVPLRRLTFCCHCTRRERSAESPKRRERSPKRRVTSGDVPSFSPPANFTRSAPHLPSRLVLDQHSSSAFCLSDFLPTLHLNTVSLPPPSMHLSLSLSFSPPLNSVNLLHLCFVLLLLCPFLTIFLSVSLDSVFG